MKPLDHVSRETLDALHQYASLTLKWTSHINLIAPSTQDVLWSRHIEDSAQVFEYLPMKCRSLLDFGSGGGFPAVVLAILARDLRPELMVSCIESDARKCAFLRTVSRETNTPLTVHAKRIEDVPSLNADVVTARAIAPISILLEYAERHRSAAGTCLFMKGVRAEIEVSEALRSWHFVPSYHASISQQGASIVEIGEFARA